MNAALSRRRLEWLLRARGTDLSVWPERDRVAALALLRTSPEARQSFADALVVEEAPEAETCVFERMQSALRRRLAPVPLLWRGIGAGALLACVAAGLYLASSQIDPDVAADPFAPVQTLTFAALDQ